MRKFILLCSALCAMLSISASPVHAQNVLWVAANGSDGNICSQINPCATFQGAINKGSVSQINCLTSGNYGPFTITASIIVDCGAGNIGKMAVGVGTAIFINTAAAATIVLRHLSLNGLGTGAYEIVATFSSGTLIVEDCTIQDFAGGIGIYFSTGGGRGLLHVSNSEVSGNFDGIYVMPLGSQIASVALNRVEMTANADSGLVFAGSGVVAGTMRNSVVGANGTTGIKSNASQVYFTVEESSVVANLTNGIETDTAGSVVNVGTSTIGGNGTGVKAIAGSLISFGNNQISANGTNGSFTATTSLQ